MVAAIDNGNKTMTQILIEQGARAIEVQAEAFVGDSVIRLGYGYGDRGANQADIRLTADEANEWVKAINATVPVWGGTAPCGRASLYGYHKKSTPQEMVRRPCTATGNAAAGGVEAPAKMKAVVPDIRIGCMPMRVFGIRNHNVR